MSAFQRATLRGAILHFLFAKCWHMLRKVEHQDLRRMSNQLCLTPPLTFLTLGCNLCGMWREKKQTTIMNCIFPY